MNVNAKKCRRYIVFIITLEMLIKSGMNKGLPPSCWWRFYMLTNDKHTGNAFFESNELKAIRLLSCNGNAGSIHALIQLMEFEYKHDHSRFALWVIHRNISKNKFLKISKLCCEQYLRYHLVVIYEYIYTVRVKKINDSVPLMKVQKLLIHTQSNTLVGVISWNVIPDTFILYLTSVTHKYILSFMITRINA